MITQLLTILVYILPFVVEALANRRKKRPMDEAISKNDFSAMSGSLSDVIDRLP